MAQGKWIWFPDDFEIELSDRFMTKRYERDVFIPPFWRTCAPYRNVKFSKTVELAAEEEIAIEVEGKFNVAVDGAYLYGVKNGFTVSAGKHEIVVSVYNPDGLPAIKLSGRTVATDGGWTVTANDHAYKNAAFDDDLVRGGNTPNSVRLPAEEVEPVGETISGGKKIYDFGKEIFASVRLYGFKSAGRATVYYGESLAEACDAERCELISEDFEEKDGFFETGIAKAFRYVSVEGASFDKLTAMSEYRYKGREFYFRSGDSLLNEVYDVSAYTLSLASREFLIDGIKRDRWIWMADAYQSSLMQFYSFFDRGAIKRTLVAMYGKGKFDQYLNHIMDYTFMWIICFGEYCDRTGDDNFAKNNLYKAFEIMEYCLSRRDGDGLMDSRPDDWVFVDWADLDNGGQVCYEQFMLLKALKVCVSLSHRYGFFEREMRYSEIYASTKGAVEKFWDEEKGAYVYSFKNGKSDGKILRQPNIMAVLYDLCDEDRKIRIRDNVLKNPAITPITTPYMRFFELSALMELGEKAYVLGEMRSYWGGMLGEGATTFWESYDASEKGDEKYAMYGRKYGKSLCHAWSAGPLYLIGRYVVGLTAESGGAAFRVEPDAACLDEYECRLPFADGFVTVVYRGGKVSATGEGVGGTLVVDGAEYRVIPGETREVAVR